MTIDKYVKLALSLGAEHAIPVTPDDLVFDGRTILKCMFGCTDWRLGCTCPSREGALKPWELEPLLRKYKTVLIIHSKDKKIAQKVSFEIEKAAFFNGDVMSFSTSDCDICESCAGRDGESCRNVKRARPSFHSLGVDVFATVKKLSLSLNLDLPLVPLREKGGEENWYSAAWLN